MSRGLTIAEFVQQVLYSIYKVRLDVDESLEGSFHCKSDKFKEVVMEANLMLQEFQKEQDWNFLRDRWEMGISHNDGGIQEFTLPDDVYKVCTGYGDAVRLHRGPYQVKQIPWEEARTGNKPRINMFDSFGELNTVDWDVRAFFVGDTITFSRPWTMAEEGHLVETDVIRYIEPLHICDNSCPDHCPQAYDEVHFKWMPDPLYFILKTAAGRAAADPSASDMAQSLTDQAQKVLSSIRENDSSHTTPDQFDTVELGYLEVL